MTYNVVKDFSLGEKAYLAGTTIDITDEQIAELPEETAAAFREVVQRGDVVEVAATVADTASVDAPVEPSAPAAPVAPEVPVSEVTDSQGKEPASAAVTTESPADAAVTSASPSADASSSNTAGQGSTPSTEPAEKPKGWVGNHTVMGGKTLPGGALFVRDPKLTRK